MVGQWATPIRKAWWLKSPLRAQGPTTRAEASQLGSCHRFFMFFSMVCSADLTEGCMHDMGGS